MFQHVMSRGSGVSFVAHAPSIFSSRATSIPEVWRLAQSVCGNLATGWLTQLVHCRPATFPDFAVPGAWPFSLEMRCSVQFCSLALDPRAAFVPKKEEASG